MKHRVFLIAALFACMLGVFAVFAQDGVKTAEFELNPPAETFDAVVTSALEMPMAAAAYADSVQDKLFGESGNGLLASL